MEESLEYYIQQAEQAKAAKNAFLSVMSHEMRTPLNAIIGLSELTLAFDDIHDEVRENMRKVHESGVSLLSIFNDMLDVAKIESGNLVLEPIEYETPSFINDTLTLNLMGVVEKEVLFTLQVDEKLPFKLYGDDLRVKQIFNNILNNAFKYTHAGEVLWSVTCERDGDELWLVSTISDNGIGIKPEDIPNLFENHSQVNTEANREIEGTGLGFVLTKQLVELMDGTITVESELGKGSVFTVRIRQGIADESPIGDEMVDSLQSFSYFDDKKTRNNAYVRIRLPYARVLVVDDVQTNLDVTRGMLKPYGMHVDCVLSGRDAIDLVRSGAAKYNAIFMDHMMPGMDGIETTGIIRNEIGSDYAKNVPIIALTANAIRGNEKFFSENGFQDFLSKPIDMIRLDAIIRKWIRDKNLESEYKEKQISLHGETVLDIRSGKDRRSGRDRRYPDRRYVLVINNGPGMAQSANGDSKSGFPDIQGIDLNAALARFGGDEESLIDVLRSYTVNTPQLVEKLRTVAHIPDGQTKEALSDYAIVIHGIKGSSRSICAESLGDKAEALEHAAQTGNIAFIEENNAAFLTELQGVLSTLSDWLTAKTDDVNAKKPIKNVPDPVTLRYLRDACEHYDVDEIELAMEQLESYRYENDSELVVWLRDQADRMAYKEIADKLHE